MTVEAQNWDELGWESAPLKALALVPDGYVQALRQAGLYVRTKPVPISEGRKPKKGEKYAPPWAVMLCEACKRYRSPSIARDKLNRALVSAQDDMEQRNAFDAAFQAGGATALAEMIESSEERAKRKVAETRGRKFAIANQRVKDWTRKTKLAETKLSYWQRRLRAAERAIATSDGGDQ
jgi:hypothetical protein